MISSKKFASLIVGTAILGTTATINFEEKLNAQEEYHTVKKGETLWAVANKYKLTVSELKKINNLKVDTLTIGQKIIVKKIEAKKITVKNGDTLYKIARENNVTVDQITKWNNLKTTNLKVGQVLTLGAENNGTNTNTNTNTNTKPTETNKVIYVVKKGDTLNRIATTHKTTVEKIMKENNLKTADIFINQKLTISGTTSGTTETKEEKVGVVTADLLNIRKEGSATASVVGKLIQNDKVVILEEKNGWMKIESKKGNGWVSSQYIRNENDKTIEKPEEKEEKAERYKVIATSLNLRESNNTNSKVITTIPYNSKVEFYKEQNGWAEVSYAGKKGWVSSQYIKKDNAQPKNKTVVLDAGHGGPDPGAISNIDGTLEKNIVLSTTLKLKTELENEGYTVRMLRSTDNSCIQLHALGNNNELKCRTDFSNNGKTDIFISIHANSAPGGVGTETFYSLNSPRSKESERLATAIHKEYQPTFGSSNRGVKTANYYVIRYTNAPSTLLEVGFLTNSSDLSKMKNQTMQTNLAKSITKGVNEYFGY